MRYGLLKYEDLNGSYNEGDYIQSLAARQFLPQIDNLISREHLNSYSGDLIRIIMNGWFMQKPQNWPPAEFIDPLFVSFHINRPYAKAMLTPRSVSYLKNVGKIGCRDYHTAQMLADKGIDAHYSACLTTTLGETYKRSDQDVNDSILFVDVAHALPDLEQLASSPLRSKFSHLLAGNIFRLTERSSILKRIIDMVPKDLAPFIEIRANSKSGKSIDEVTRFRLAHETLESYRTARIVITSRIHCALPCIAMGTPVIFIKAGQKSLSNIYRFRGVIDFMNVVDLDGDMKKYGFLSNIIDIEDINFKQPISNPGTHKPFADALKETCISWIRS